MNHMIREEEGKLFNTFINSLRKKRGCSMKQVCEGLCTSQEISFLENGKRLPDKLLQDAILERLGVGAEDYEHFVNFNEYERWKTRQGILHNITFEKMERAESLLDEYYARYGKKEDSESYSSIEEKLERQFYLSMLAQIRRYNGASGEELCMIFDEAIHLTVPALGHKPISELILSIKELNLILEAEQYRREGERIARYREITEYIERAGLDGRGMAKIYPKAVFFLCRSLIAADGKERPAASEISELLRLCNRAVDVLRNNYRMYFLWELLDIRELILERMMECYGSQGEQEKADTLGAMYRENAEWKSVLEQIYEEFRVPEKTFDYCYLYVMKGVSCINDVIRIRRQMLGMKPGELCDGICDRKTLRRLERRETIPQKAIVESLFERLGLSGALTRTELITDEPEVRRLMEEMRGMLNDRQWEKAEEILDQIKARTSMDIRNNRQALMRTEILFRWKTRELCNVEYCRQMQTALELTIPFNSFLNEGEKYLTFGEQTCIQNMLQGMAGDREELRICIDRFEDIYRYIIENELQEAFAGMFELIMGYVESELGDRGEYDQSNQYSDIIIQGCLRLRRLRALPDSLYNRCWNYIEQVRRDIPMDKILDEKKELYKCVLLSRLSRSKKDEMFFSRKLEQATKER